MNLLNLEDALAQLGVIGDHVDTLAAMMQDTFNELADIAAQDLQQSTATFNHSAYQAKRASEIAAIQNSIPGTIAYAAGISTSAPIFSDVAALVEQAFQFQSIFDQLNNFTATDIQIGRDMDIEADIAASLQDPMKHHLMVISHGLVHEEDIESLADQYTQKAVADLRGVSAQIDQLAEDIDAAISEGSLNYVAFAPTLRDEETPREFYMQQIQELRDAISAIKRSLDEMHFEAGEISEIDEKYQLSARLNTAEARLKDVLAQ